jgi:hypothetical protein
MIQLDKKGNIITNSDYAPFDPDANVVDRMHALIGLVRHQDPDCFDQCHTNTALEMLEELLPTKEQVKSYIHN